MRIITKEQYELAKATGMLEQLRGDLVSEGLNPKYPPSRQMAIAINALLGKPNSTEELAEYETFRESVKAQVDALLDALENEKPEAEVDYENSLI